MWHDTRALRLRDRARSWKARLGAEPRATGLSPQLAEELQKAIIGTVVLPGDPEYDRDRMLSNPRFSAYPQVIVYCETEADVAECLAVAGKADLPVVVRSGGHSTAGFSSQDGFLLDVSRMNDVVVDAPALTAWVGPGTDFAKLNSKLEFLGLHVPGGACPDVRVGGYMQGGGYGFTARIFGMNCDQVIAVRIILSDGRLVQADAQTNRDLYWAVRGGTGSNFGVLVGVQYRLQAGAEFAGFSIFWPLEDAAQRADAAAALAWLQENFMPGHTAPGIGYQMIWVMEGPEDGPKTPRLLMRGMRRGTGDALQAALKPVLDLPGATLQQIFQPTRYSQLNRLLLTSPYEVPEFPLHMTPMPPPEAKISRYLSRALTSAQWLPLIAYYCTAPSPYTIVAMEIYGGGIQAQPADGNAFIHRSVYCDLFCDVFWLTADEEKTARAFLKGWCDRLDPHWDGRVYQNYPAPDDPDFAANYWGDRYEVLQAVKAKYDPGNRFRYPQSIIPRPATDAIAGFPGLAEPILSAQRS